MCKYVCQYNVKHAKPQLPRNENYTIQKFRHNHYRKKCARQTANKHTKWNPKGKRVSKGNKRYIHKTIIRSITTYSFDIWAIKVRHGMLLKWSFGKFQEESGT